MTISVIEARLAAEEGRNLGAVQRLADLVRAMNRAGRRIFLS
jgi:hypothetical protein